MSGDAYPQMPKAYVPHSEIYLNGVGHYLPDDVVTNADFVARSGLTQGAVTRAAWIEARTGIQKRHWAKPEQGVSDLAAEAARELFKTDSTIKERVRHLILATISGDFPSPPTSPLVQSLLGLQGSATYDVGAACAGFVESLQLAATLTAGQGEDTLLIAADIRSKFLNLQDFNTAPLFGDGAAATLISLQKSKTSHFRLRATRAFADGDNASLIMVPGGGSAPPRQAAVDGKFALTMFDGARIFLKAREAFVEASKNFLDEIGVPLEKIAYVVPHQANSLILREVKKDLGLRDDQMIETVPWTGNTSGASVGIALHSLIQKKILKSGDLLLLAAAGGGGIVAHALVEFVA